VSADAGRTLNTPRALIEVETGDRRSSAREQTRKIEEEQAQLVNRTNYQRCKLLWGRWNDGEATDADHSDLLRTARKLVQKFQTTKAFYPADRVRKFSTSEYKALLTCLHKQGKRFTGLTRKKKKSKAQSTGAQQALENLVTRLRKGPEENATPATNVTSFQGLSFDEWHEVFVMYAVALCRKLRTEEAQMVLQAGIDANVFYHDEERLQKFKLISICEFSHGCSWMRRL
jgi:general transcription factor 3C polypeptide 3 (transcription factor C subunit 4)